PAVKGSEFGEGFSSADLRGSEYNDSFTIIDGKVSTVTNRHGGILGGMATGSPIIFKCCFKPTPSIAKKQQSVDLKKMLPIDLTIAGRHDTTVVIRAVPVVESVCAITLLDLILEGECEKNWKFK
ncbi:MAG: chorismate synthase, partial [Oscillospiraceae bacterium]